MRLKIPAYPKREPPDFRNWRPWFAWYPVLIDDTLVWLEKVERRKAGVYPPTFTCPHDHRVRS